MLSHFCEWLDEVSKLNGLGKGIMSDESLPSLMRKAESASGIYQKLAEKVSDSVIEVDEWLAGLPGKIAVESHTENPFFHPEHNDLAVLVVGFRRLNKEWCLAYGEAEDGGHSEDLYHGPKEWRPVREASLKVKAAALQLVPELIRRFSSEQQSLIDLMSTVPNLKFGNKGGN